MHEDAPSFRGGRVFVAGSLVYVGNMRRRGPLHQLRSFVAALFGIANEHASDGTWWETDLILVFLIGALTLGLLALF